MIFEKKFEQFRKKMCSDFSKVGSKESQENTEDKVSQGQADIVKF
jgi:hypothetical protein